MSTKTHRHSHMFDRVDTYDEAGAYIHSHMERRADAGLNICMTHSNINCGGAKMPTGKTGTEQQLRAETDAERKAWSGLRATDDAAKAVQKTEHRVTLDSLIEKIATVEYYFPTTMPTLTICILVVENGFAVVGKSASADPDNYDVEYGRRAARDDAVRQLWALEGYLLRERLSL